LEVSRITSGKIELRREPVDLAAVIQSATETSKPLIEASRHGFTLSMPAEPLTVMADSLRLSQVVANLLNNAAKYTEAGGTISLSVSRIGENAEISVKDTGVGISPEMLHDVFRMFSQAGRDRKRAQGGLGIGLALAKDLAEKHGGQIEARSEGEGRGSEFIVRLPLAAPRPLQTAKQPTPAQAPAGAAAGSRVLVVDDNCDAASSLASLLRVMGSEVRTANDGQAALEAIESFRPSLVLLDLGMPDMSGYEVAEHIQKIRGGKECILVALTGWGQAEDRQRTKAAGFRRHLVKPIEFGTLKTLVAEFHAEMNRDAESCVSASLP
jgi:CheY-like chemotaxis protein